MSHNLPSSNYENAVDEIASTAAPGLIYAVLALVDATNRQTDDMVELTELRDMNAQLRAALRAAKELLVQQATVLAALNVTS